MAGCGRETVRIAFVHTAGFLVDRFRGLMQAQQGRMVEIEAVVRPDVYQALAAGDRPRHDALVTAAAQEAAERSDVLVLAQASIAHLQDELAQALGKPVLASPPLLMREIGRRLHA